MPRCLLSTLLTPLAPMQALRSVSVMASIASPCAFALASPIAFALALALTPALAPAAQAEIATWQTDAAVGPSEVSYTLSFTCTGPAAVCDPLNAYSDTQISTLGGAATLQLDPVADTLQFDPDGTVDLGDGMGPVPTHLALSGSDMTFAGLALFGIPEVESPLVFSVDQPLIPLTGLELLPPGTYPISSTMSWGGVANVVGDLALLIPEIVVTPAPVAVTGTLEILGDVDTDGLIEFEIRNLQATTSSTDQYVEGTIVVDVEVTAVLVAHLSGEVAGTVPPVPLLTPPTLAALCALLAAGGAARLTGRQRRDFVA